MLDSRIRYLEIEDWQGKYLPSTHEPVVVAVEVADLYL